MQLQDLKIEAGFYRAPAGGQHITITSHAVRITHASTAMIAQCATERSQHRNLEICKTMLEAGLSAIGWKDPE